MSHPDRGQLTPLLALVLVLCLALALLIARLGAEGLTHTRATTAADAAALAGALDGRSGADRLAAANGGRVVAYHETDQGVEVVVELEGVAVRSAAEHSRPELGELDPGLIRALIAAERHLGEPIPVVSGRRSRAAQQALWDARHQNPYPVAPPGTSAHELGLAVDVPASIAGRLAAVAGAFGLCRPLPVTDPIHFELCRRTPSR